MDGHSRFMSHSTAGRAAVSPGPGQRRLLTSSAPGRVLRHQQHHSVHLSQHTLNNDIIKLSSCVTRTVVGKVQTQILVAIVASGWYTQDMGA